MNRAALLATLFAVGLVAVMWVGWGFVGSNTVALLMTVLIAVVYGVGALEVWRFHGTTQSLVGALGAVPRPLASLDDWVARLPAEVQQAVRSRIEGERTALPGLALTPYLVGLLVMLGMLGTFLGMVVTFKGAVFALEGSTDLQTIRSALAAPIKGLGLSFGTSVAGVAASAVLGLMSAVCRRERLAAVRLLDARIATDFKPFTRAQARQGVYQAIHAQARALPDVVERLNTIVLQMESRNQHMNEQLLARQAQFHTEVGVAYTGLATSVGRALNESLSASARIAGESLQPIVEQAMTRLADESRQMHQHLREAADAHLQGLSTQFTQTTQQVSDTWAGSLATQSRANDNLVDRLDGALASFNTRFDQRATAWLDSVAQAAADAQQAQQVADSARQAAWAASVTGVADSLQQSWAQASKQSEALVRSRVEAEAHWLQQHTDRMAQLDALWRSTLSGLRDDEVRRGQAAVDRLDALQTALASQLATLGAALEAPMTRLMQTAAEVPQAAAGVMAELRQEMTRLTERDSAAFDAQRGIMAQIGSLLHSLNHASGEQRVAVESLVAAASAVLDQANERFARTLAEQVNKAEGVSAHVNASAIELASLGDAFHHGVQLFSASNDKLVEGLQRIESGLKHATARSDEQLAYYVAQAREVIDLSIASQQGIVDDLRRLHAVPATASTTSTAASGAAA